MGVELWSILHGLTFWDGLSTRCMADLVAERAYEGIYLCTAAIRSVTPTILMARLRL